MPPEQRSRLIVELRERIRRLERSHAPERRPALPFGVAEVDRRLPGGGLATGALHEVIGGGGDVLHAAAATLFTAGVMARLQGPVLWCLGTRDLFAPGLTGAGLDPDRVIYAEAGDAATVLLVMEEGLRHGGLGGVVGEVGRLPMPAARRLQLAAEVSGVTAVALRRWRARTANGSAPDEPTAAVSRWRIATLPSAPLPAPGVGRGRWQVDLLRCRGAEAATWNLEACDAQGRLALAAELADRPAAAADGWRGYGERAAIAV